MLSLFVRIYAFKGIIVKLSHQGRPSSPIYFLQCVLRGNWVGQFGQNNALIWSR